MVSLTTATTALNPKQEMTDYKKYSLENLENWLHDAISSSEATPREIYDVIVGVVKETYYYHKDKASQADELLALLNGTRQYKNNLGYSAFAGGNGAGGVSYGNNVYQNTLNIDISDILKEREYYEQSNMNEQELSQYKDSLICDKNDPSPECQGAWNDFWESGNDTEYTIREAEYYNKEVFVSEDGDIYPVKDKVTKWVLPVQIDGLTGDCFINLPEDLLELSGLKEGDTVEWINRGDGSFEMRKVNGTK